VVNSAAVAAAVTFGFALLAPLSIPAAFGSEATSIALGHRHHHVLRRHTHRGVESGAIGPVASAAPGWTPFQGPFLNPFATPPQPLEWPKIAPYPPGQGDTDGMSRNIEDCNKGCIDGPY